VSNVRWETEHAKEKRGTVGTQPYTLEVIELEKRNNLATK